MPMLIRRVLLRLWLFVTASAALGFMVYGPFMPVLEGGAFPGHVQDRAHCSAAAG